MNGHDIDSSFIPGTSLPDRGLATGGRHGGVGGPCAGAPRSPTGFIFGRAGIRVNGGTLGVVTRVDGPLGIGTDWI